MKEILAPVAEKIAKLEPLLVDYLLTPNEPTNQVIRHIFSAGGKRIRPALFFLSSGLIGYNGEHLNPIASVCEYIHTASLLHDDVIDNSTVRRNKPTANAIWGDQTAVLAGDLIYSAACRLMVKTQSLDLIDTFAECIRFMSESELFQLELLWKANTTLAQYERVVAGKTAALFAGSAKTPGYLSGLKPSAVNALDAYGKNLGFAFQIADDCLDYEGSLETVGKTVVADLLEGKVTLPVISALHSSQPNKKRLSALVEKILNEGSPTDAEKMELVELVQSLGGLNNAKGVARDYATAALSALEEVAYEVPNTPYSQSCLKALQTLPTYVVERKN